MIVDTKNVAKISRIPETDIDFGTAVLSSDDDAYCCSASSVGDSETARDKFLGIAMRDTTSEGGIVNPWETERRDGYRKSSWCVTIICMGRVWAIAQSPVHEGDPVVILPDGGLMTASNPDWIIPGARWATSAPANMLAIVELNTPSTG